MLARFLLPNRVLFLGGLIDAACGLLIPSYKWKAVATAPWMRRHSSILAAKENGETMRELDTTEWLRAAFDDMVPTTQYKKLSSSEFLTHPPISLDVNQILDIISSTKAAEIGRSKNILAITRGTATGKTTALDWTLREARIKWPDTLSVGITFGHHTTADSDLAMKGFRGWEMTYAVGIVARLAIAVFDASEEDVYNSLRRVHHVLNKRRGIKDAQQTVISCLKYLLKRTGKQNIVLAVDEVMAAEEALVDAFPPTKANLVEFAAYNRTHYDALKIVRRALLDADEISDSAFLMSSLEWTKLSRESGHCFQALPVPAALAPEDVLSQWWMVDCSKNASFFDDPTLPLDMLRGSAYRKTIYKPANQLSEQVLLHLAALSGALPRGLQFMKKQLDKDMKDVSPDEDGLKPISMNMDDAGRIIEHALEAFQGRYRRYTPTPPSAAIILGWLFNEKVPLADVYKDLRRSVFTNSIQSELPLQLQSCVLSLAEAFEGEAANLREARTTIKLLIRELLNTGGKSDGQLHHGEPVQEAAPLEVAFLRMLQARLAAKVEDPTTVARRVSVKELLYPDSLELTKLPNDVVTAQVSLPASDSPHFSVDARVLEARLNENPVTFFKELNAIDLTDWRFQVLRGAPGDCFDVGLLFIDATTNKVCLWLGDLKSAREGAPLEQLPTKGTFNGGSKEIDVAAGLKAIRANRKCFADASPSGKALTEEGRVLLSYVSTRPGQSRFIAGTDKRCDVMMVGRKITRLFLTEAFFRYYALYRSV